MREKKTPPIFAYLTEEEKESLEMLAKTQNRSVSNMARVLLVSVLKETGILEETIMDNGLVQQKVNLDVVNKVM